MSRSKYKPEYLHKSLMLNSLKKKENWNPKDSFNIISEREPKIKKMVKFFCLFNRSSKIHPYLVDNVLGIYNGFLLQPLKVTSNAVGFRLGSFSLTRKTPRKFDSKKNQTKGKGPRFRQSKVKTRAQKLRFSFKLNVRKIKNIVVKPVIGKFRDKHNVISKKRKKIHKINLKTFNFKKNRKIK